MPRTSRNPAIQAGRLPLKAKTFRSMGTVISLTMPVNPAAGGNAEEDELAAATAVVVERLFLDLDQTFSLYRADSEASTIARGELSLPDASAGMRERYAEALGWRLRTKVPSLRKGPTARWTFPASSRLSRSRRQPPRCWRSGVRTGV